MAKEEQADVKSPEPNEITLNDMPLTPSLAPKVDSGLRMPTLNRLTSTDWPLTNRIRESSNGKVRIVRSEDAGKSPTPKASASRISSFRSLQEKEDTLGSMVQPLLFRTVSEMSDMGAPESRFSNDGVQSWVDQSQEEKTVSSIQALPPHPLQFSLPSVVTSSPSNLKTNEVVFHRDGRRARFAKSLSPVHRHRRLRDDDDKIDTTEATVLNAKRKFSFSKTTTTQREKKRSRSSSDVSNASNTSNGLGCSCKRSKCRKKYCLCFANGVACISECRCEDCGNTPEDGLFSGLYSTRGCRCDNSRCKKKYCVCFQDGKFCSPCCKCKNCENQPGDHNNFSSVPMRKKKKTMTTTKAFKRKIRRSGDIRLSGVSVVVL